ncbi:Beta-xylosidase [Pseudobutyrivibrio sp. ACV-2]|uniref:GH39 family glycosyl hydrolase n=1 Tax=Pseudobutyrivibrio sp. ACV-2 TaxID=1520801 RepID=UPI000898EFBB|nr:helix-turn-helix domain-containing protein [Pseudobutyrivibrio sp. ACV-2]SEA37370.1 Beta-xylosidase [Pseudobutyrivibrio sp. ACV-2]
MKQSMSSEYTTEILTKENGNTISSREDYFVLYIVRGSVSITLQGQLHRCEKGDFFFLNPSESAQLNWQKESVILNLKIDSGILHTKSGIQDIFFSAHKTVSENKKLSHTAELIKGFWAVRADSNSKGGFGETGAYYTLLDDLIKHYVVKNPISKGSLDDYGSKMLRYIHMNFRNHISLDEVADSLYISTPTASRVFYDTTGVKFGDYVRTLRLNKAKQLLETTGDTITEIALNVGFGSPSAMNKLFLKYIGTTPSEYRNAHPMKPDKSEAENDEALSTLLESSEDDEDHELTVNLSNVSRNTKLVTYQPPILNVGTLKSLSSAQMQKQVTYITDSLGIKYVRLWGMFANDLHLQTENKGVYNFSFMDEILDYIVDHDLNLFLDIGLRGDGARANESTMVFEEQNFLIFHSKEEWLHMVESFLDHIRYRYDRAVSNWVIEVSFFLNNAPYYEGTGYSAVDAWNETVAMIRRKIPGMKVAGPGMPLVNDKDLNKMWVEHLLTADEKPDYITCISFPYNDSIKDGDERIESYRTVGDREFHRSSNTLEIVDRIKGLTEILRANNYLGKCIITDWNYSISSRNYLQDSTFRAAYTAQCIINSMDDVDVFGIFYASDLLSAYSDTRSLLQGSAGILSRDGIEKPVFHAFRFLGQLGKQVFFKTDNCIITGNNDGSEIKILLHNCQSPEADYYLLSEDAFKPTEVSQMFSSKPLILKIKLEGVAFGDKVQIHQNILNEDHGSVLHHWIQMGCSHNLSREDLQYLKNVSIPETLIEEITIENSSLELNVELKPNEVRQICLRGAN